MPMIDYNDPNDVWRRTGYSPYKGMSEDQLMWAGCLQGAVFIALIFIILLLYTLLK